MITYSAFFVYSAVLRRGKLHLAHTLLITSAYNTNNNDIRFSGLMHSGNYGRLSPCSIRIPSPLIHARIPVMALHSRFARATRHDSGTCKHERTICACDVTNYGIMFTLYNPII